MGDGDGDFALYDNTRPYELRFDAPLQQYVLKLSGQTLRTSLRDTHARRGDRGAGHLMIGMITALHREQIKAKVRVQLRDPALSAVSIDAALRLSPSTVRRANGQVFFFIAQVLKPNIAYGGHQPIAPVASGTMPSHPQTPILPFSVRPIKTNPMTIRAIRSTPPTLLLMMNSLTQGDGPTSAMRYTQLNLPGYATQNLILVKPYCDNRIKLLQWLNHA
jgi:hypothetical protein